MRVLVATDGSESAKEAAETLRLFPLPPASEALVLGVVAPPWRVFDAASAGDLQRCFKDMANAAVEEARALVAGRFVSSERRVAEGDAREEIIRAAEDWNADLIVLGARGLGRMASLLLGSVSVGVARHAHCPVLVVKGKAAGVRGIVIGIDGSEDALAAVRFVAQLPLDSSVVVRLLGVVQPPQHPAIAPDLLHSTVWNRMAAATEDLRRELEATVERTKQLLAGCSAKIETVVEVGQVAYEIVHAASRPGFDLVVVGARGLGRFDRLLLGSVSDTVLRHAPCSVIVAKHA